MDKFKCIKCEKIFDEFEADYNFMSKNGKELCSECIKKLVVVESNAIKQGGDMSWKSIIEDRMERLKEITKIQCSKGNYDVDEYMRGMANGLILAEAILEDKEPEYKEVN